MALARTALKPRLRLDLRAQSLVLRFVCMRAMPLQALTTAAEPGAQLLLPGTGLDGWGKGTGGCFVVPVQTDRATGTA